MTPLTILAIIFVVALLTVGLMLANRVVALEDRVATLELNRRLDRTEPGTRREVRSASEDEFDRSSNVTPISKPRDPGAA